MGVGVPVPLGVLVGVGVLVVVLVGVCDNVAAGVDFGLLVIDGVGVFVGV